MKSLFIFCALVALTMPAFATGDDPLFPRLIGEWRSNADAFGGPATSVMTWSEVLGGKFVRLDYRIEMRAGTDQASVFEGVAYYKMSDGDSVDAFWADNTGYLHPISAERDIDTLLAYWGVEGGKYGRTRYHLIGQDELQATDWIKTPEGWRQFNQNVLTRVGS